MDELNALAGRLDAALAALEAHGGGDSGTADTAALQAENDRLSDELAALKAAREKDLAELDALIAQLKPLVEESA